GEITIVKDAVAFLNASDLAEQIELVKFSPIVLNLEELSKLWSVFFQTAYRLSVAYQASVVLIDGKETPRATLPVRERAVHGRTLQRPVIEKLLSQKPNPPNAPILENQPIVVGDNLILVGKGFQGEQTIVRFDQEEIPLVPPIEFSDTQIKFRLISPTIPAEALLVGKHCVQVVHQLDLDTNQEPHKGFESNPVFFMLRPTVEVLP
ncbi:MAG: Pvc16 family protein, partial [bacterium]